MRRLRLMATSQRAEYGSPTKIKLYWEWNKKKIKFNYPSPSCQRFIQCNSLSKPEHRHHDFWNVCEQSVVLKGENH